MSQELEDSIPDYEFKCRNSDYRMVQSDPNFDVVDIKADVSQQGNVIVTSITAVSKSDINSRISNVIVLMGAECYVRDEIELYQDEILDVKIG